MKRSKLIPQIALTVSMMTLSTPMAFAQTAETKQLDQIIRGTETSVPNNAGPSLPTVPAGAKPGPIDDQSKMKQLLDSTVTSTTNQEGTNLGTITFPKDGQSLPVGLPPTDHNRNKTIDLGPIHTGPLLRIASLGPIQLEASYNEPVSLASVLNYTLGNSLPIRINDLTVAANKYGFYGSLANFLPSATTGYTWTHSHIYPHTNSNSRVYTESVSMPVFQGGRVMYGMLSQLYRYKASKQQYRASVNDTLLNAYNAYYNLVLQRALLQIRIKSVEVSQTQLQLNQQLYVAGTGTRFAVMQSQTQLALDRQALLQQQVQLRLASMNLAFIANMPLAANSVPLESTVSESSLVDETLAIDDLLSLSLTRRPELKQYQLLYLSAARNIQIAAASLYPTASFTQTYSHSSTTISQPQQTGGTLTSVGTSSTGSTTSTNGGATTNTTGTGGTSGSTTNGTTTGSTTNGGTSATGSTSTTSTSSTSSNSVVGAGQFGGLFNTISFQFNVNYTLSNLGVSSITNILSARAISQQTMLQANQVLQQVSQQVRAAYLNALTAREQIDVTATGVESSAEELRLANLRVQMGIGTNLEAIQAQRDYIQALINQAQAIITSNQAQAQLLHDTGLISVDTLLAGYKPPKNFSNKTF